MEAKPASSAQPRLHSYADPLLDLVRKWAAKIWEDYPLNPFRPDAHEEFIGAFEQSGDRDLFVKERGKVGDDMAANVG